MCERAIILLDRGVVQGIADKVNKETEELSAFGVLAEETEGLGSALAAQLFKKLVAQPIPDKNLKLTLSAKYIEEVTNG